MKDYKLKYKDVYIYGTVTQYFIGKSVIDEVESPYVEDGQRIGIILRGNAVRGYGRRQWQRDKLERDRGMVIALAKGNLSALIAVQDKEKNLIEIFITDALTEVQRQIAKDILSQLQFNDIKVIVSDEEKKRNKLEKLWNAGDRIQREAGRSGRNDYTDYSEDDEDDSDSGW